MSGARPGTTRAPRRPTGRRVGWSAATPWPRPRHARAGQVQGWLDRYATALRWITKALGLLEAAPTSAGGGGLRPAPELVRPVLPGGRSARPRHRVLRPGHRRRRGGGEKVALARRCGQGVGVHGARHLDAYADAERTLAIYEDLDDLPGQANALNLLGMAAYCGGLERCHGVLPAWTGHRSPDGQSGQGRLRAVQHREILIDQGRFDEGVGMLTDVAASGGPPATAPASPHLGHAGPAAAARGTSRGRSLSSTTPSPSSGGGSQPTPWRPRRVGPSAC